MRKSRVSGDNISAIFLDFPLNFRPRTRFQATFRPFQAILGHFRQFQAFLGPFRPFLGQIFRHFFLPKKPSPPHHSLFGCMLMLQGIEVQRPNGPPRSSYIQLWSPKKAFGTSNYPPQVLVWAPCYDIVKSAKVVAVIKVVEDGCRISCDIIQVVNVVEVAELVEVVEEGCRVWAHLLRYCTSSKSSQNQLGLRCRVSVWAHLCSSQRLHCLLFPTNSHLTGYSQCVCQRQDNKVRGAGGRQGGTGCVQAVKMGQHILFQHIVYTTHIYCLLRKLNLSAKCLRR